MELMEDLDPEEARAIIDPALKLMMVAAHHLSIISDIKSYPHPAMVCQHSLLANITVETCDCVSMGGEAARQLETERSFRFGTAYNLLLQRMEHSCTRTRAYGCDDTRRPKELNC